MKAQPCAVILGFLLTLSCVSAGILPEARCTVKLVDEDGRPLPNTPATIGFSEESHKGLADTNGCFTATGAERYGDPRCGCKTEGYYESALPCLLANYDTKSHRWLPWNPVVTMVVRRVVNPIPMYAKRVRAVVPVLDEFVGYDLMKGDWVAPYGQGCSGDLQFRLRKRYRDINDFDSSLELCLTNAADGVQKTSLLSFQPSVYRLPRAAATEGYSATFALSESSTNYFKPREDESLLLRIRSTTNAAGMIGHAFYGKIRGCVSFDVRRHPTGVVKFTYYLNPTPNDRNLEFDPTKNLFTNLSSLEEVRDP